MVSGEHDLATRDGHGLAGFVLLLDDVEDRAQDVDALGAASHRHLGLVELLDVGDGLGAGDLAGVQVGAYGIPQALPGSKMASSGADWRTNPVTQINWGIGYIKGRYGTPCSAWAHSNAVGWY